MTSKRFSRPGQSTAVMSMKHTNLQPGSSRRKVSDLDDVGSLDGQRQLTAHNRMVAHA